MLNIARQQKIYEMIRKKGSISVSELQKKLNVSDMTIRRDLAYMKNEGMIVRVHGGATIAGILSPGELTFQDRRTLNRELKLEIAKHAASLINVNDTIFVDGSTTCAELAGILPQNMNLTVFTNSLDVINKLRWRQGVTVVSFGGQLAPDGNTFDGIVAVENAERIWVDKCFFSGASFNTDGVLNSGIVGTAVKKQMLKNSRLKCLVADSSKYNGSGVMELCKWPSLDVFITDSLLPEEGRSIFTTLETETHFVEMSHEILEGKAIL